MNSLNEQLTGSPGQNEEVHIEMAVVDTDDVDLKRKRFHFLSEFMQDNGLDAATIAEWAHEIELEVESQIEPYLYSLLISNHCSSFRRSGRMT